nr:MAG TPA: Protein of unknown function (DUF3278) [Caudoviricetes sp.]
MVFAMMEKLYKFFYRQDDENDADVEYTQKERNYFWMGVNFGAFVGIFIVNVILWGMIALYPHMGF